MSINLFPYLRAAQGWQCPACKAVHAPGMATCPCSQRSPSGMPPVVCDPDMPRDAVTIVHASGVDRYVLRNGTLIPVDEVFGVKT